MSPLEFDRTAVRIREEFQEMPGLQLTLPQMTRLCGLEPSICRAIVDALVGSSFLRWTAGGLLARVDGHSSGLPAL